MVSKHHRGGRCDHWVKVKNRIIQPSAASGISSLRQRRRGNVERLTVEQSSLCNLRSHRAAVGRERFQQQQAVRPREARRSQVAALRCTASLGPADTGSAYRKEYPHVRMQMRRTHLERLKPALVRASHGAHNVRPLRTSSDRNGGRATAF